MSSRMLQSNLTAEERGALLARAPDLYFTEEEEQEIKRKTTNYLLYWSDISVTYLDLEEGMKTECSCCGELRFYSKAEWRRKRKEEAGLKSLVTCPNCGERILPVARGRLRSGATLEQKDNFLLFRNTADGLWGYAIDVIRKFYPVEQEETNELFGSTRALFFFAPGKAQVWKAHWTFNSNRWNRTLEPGKKIGNPWPNGPYYSCVSNAYNAVQPGAIRDGACRYFAWEPVFGNCEASGEYYTGIIQFLALSALKPQTEMLAKGGLGDILRIMCNQEEFYGNVFRWSRKGLTGFTGLKKTAAKRWLETVANLTGDGAALMAAKILRLMQMGQSAETAEAVCRLWNEPVQAVKVMEDCGITAEQVVRYLEKQRSSEKGTLFLDYLKAAKKLRYDLSREDVRLPKRLREAHDSAVEAVHYEENKIAIQKYQKRYKKLQEKYEYEAFGMKIVVPKDDRAIILEGKTLKHCVGGYAARHLEGKTTILFLRKIRTPDRSFLTIEIEDKTGKLRQVHGYRNEGYKQKNPRTCRDKFAYWLEPWLEWVRAGSPRDKRGRPVQPKARENA